MQHSIHVMFGKASSEALLELHRYVAINSNENISDFFTALLYLRNDDNVNIEKVVKKQEERLTFTSNLDDICPLKYDNEFSSDKENLLESVKGYIQTLWQQRINTEYKGNQPLHFCLYLPLYDHEVWSDVKFLMEQIKQKLNNRARIDIIGFCEDMAKIFDPSKSEQIDVQYDELHNNTRKLLDEIVCLRRGGESSNWFNNFIVMQNRTNSRSLDLNLQSIVNILGELALISIENYEEAFGGINIQKKEVQGIGLSVLTFDKYYFQEYLLQDSFIKILNQEQINRDKVDITDAAKKIDALLTPWLTVMSDFYRAEIAVKLQMGNSLESILPNIHKELAKKIDQLNEAIVNQIFHNPNLSLPEKKGLVSVLLGLDDELFGNGTLIHSEQKILLDIERECVNFFVKENNLLLTKEETKDSYVLPPYQLDNAGSDSNDEDKEENLNANFPIDELKELRYKQRNCIANIRQLEEQLSELKKNLTQIEESKKCLIEGGKIIIDNEEFQLLHHDDNIVPLEDKYIAHTIAAKTIDISNGFTGIKNQGQQGACMSFSLVSVFEYFLKKNKEQFPDLSEQFLYYNARKRDGRENFDEGSNSVASIMSLSEDGLCSEEMWPYKVGGFAERPSDEAYAEARSRRVKRAVMVEKKIDDIKSALYDGLPVVFSVDIFPSFGQGVNGFISMPSEEEIQQLKESKENHAHAMVFCGYNDEQRVFKVRNSWGTSFGDKGYCYLSYDYIMQYAYWDMVAIQEIEVSEPTDDTQVEKTVDTVFVIKQTDRPQLKFLETDLAVGYALRKNTLDKLHCELRDLQGKSNALRDYCEDVKVELQNKNKRDQLYKDAIRHRELQIQDLEEARTKNAKEKIDVLKSFRKNTYKISILAICNIFLITIILWYGLYWLGDCFYGLRNYDGWISNGFFVVSVILLVIYVIYNIYQYKDIQAKYDRTSRQINAQITDIKSIIDILKAKYELAGNVITQIFALTTKMQQRHSAIHHYLLNLKEWYRNTSEKHAQMEAQTKVPFIPLIQNDVLDGYFRAQVDSIVKEKNLWQFIENYEPSERGIIDVQQNIKQQLLSKIDDYFKDFSIADYLINIKDQKKYPYLVHNFNDILDLFNDITRRSELFLQYNLYEESYDNRQVIIVRADNENQKNQLEYKLQDAITNASFVTASSPHKLVFFRIHELDAKQVVL